MKFTFSENNLPKNKNIVIAIADDLKLGAIAKEIDKGCDETISNGIKTREFKGKKGDILSLVAPTSSAYDNIFIVGLGVAKKIDALVAQTIGGKIYAALNAAKVKSTLIVVDGHGVKVETEANVAYGISLRSYQFDKYRTTVKKEDKPKFSEVNIFSNIKKDTKALFDKLQKVADGVFLTRDVVTEPPNVLYPESYADIVKKELTAVGATVKILGEKQLSKLGMGALLGVGQGSARESKVVVISYNGGKKSDKPLAFVGKGVTFDTGGISIKPSNGMEDMKYDMGGSGVVVGLMKALAGRKAKVNAVGIIGLVENMPGSNAQRPSDVVTSMSGQTIEVLNTDAEGRLVLADILTYIQQKHNPQIIVDLATLTGAIVVALADQYAGIFSNNDKLSDNISAAGFATDEKVWRFPLTEEYDKMIDSEIADMQNIGNGRGAGSITAAQFLKRFIENDTPWIHIDIAGVSWDKKGKDTSPKGATAFGVRLLNEFVEKNYE